jgi:NAD(P)-dependent dehydrogenase (short-subunit alcohol dehydrogenase family)
VFDKDGDTANRLCAALASGGAQALALAGSVEVEADIAQAVSDVIEAYGQLDILVCNAAALHLIPEDVNVHTMTVDVWDTVLAVNLKGAMLACKHALPHMIAAGGGSIVALSSTAGMGGDLTRPAYAASKAGIIQLTRAVAAEYGKQGIRCNCVAPGLVMTPRNTANLKSEFVDMHVRHSMTPYLGVPGDIAQAVAFLASDAARFITGQVIPVDGGMTAASAVLADSR